ncbi:MAG TPA: OsmC family protein [Acidobacteriaceae bacterium]|jgi:putative redox protein|nr:OsmC family protein [Acidobacteriaceae bacterium]
MRVVATWKSGQQYDGVSGSGRHVTIDADAAHTAGPGPMEMVLMGLCACTSVDVISILAKKREPFTGLRVTAEAEQAAEPPRVFTSIRLTYRVSGNVSEKAMRDAVGLSKDKYCSVSKMLEKTASIDFAIEHEESSPGGSA